MNRLHADTKLKYGYTLVEVLAVVAIIGILSSLGVVGLQGAVANHRIKDAGLNVAAYMERAANEANRLSEDVCLAIGLDEKSLRLFKGSCDNANTMQQNSTTNLLGQLTLDAPVTFINTPLPDNCKLLLSSGNSTLGVNFTPKLGLSAVPTGCFVMRYGNTSKYAAAIKYSTRNTVVVKFSYDGGKNWSER